MLSNISGFPEFLPAEQLAFNRIVHIIQGKFEQYGFIPLDTPAVEKVSTLLSKGNDNEIYGLHRLADTEGNVKRELGLRFDLTVPLARYVAQHYGQLTFPYRRYHIAPVWRGERPQAGRYRQFYQCDIDVIGEGNLALMHDAELLTIICDIFIAIGLPRFTIKINNRKLLGGLIKSFGIEDEEVPAVLRIIDKFEKIDITQFNSELESLGLSAAAQLTIKDLLQGKRTNAEWLDYLRTLTEHPEFQEGLDELKRVLADSMLLGAKAQHIRIDPSLARGLAYYTGTVYETKLDDCPELGSVCGGGRYANLAGSFTNKQLPGVGISIGISRLIPKMLELGLLKADTASTAPVLVTTQDANHIQHYAQIAAELRNAGVGVELYLQSKSLGSQMKYANKKGFKVVIIADTSELAVGNVNIRTLASGKQIVVPIGQVVDTVKHCLA